MGDHTEKGDEKMTDTNAKDSKPASEELKARARAEILSLTEEQLERVLELLKEI